MRRHSPRYTPLLLLLLCGSLSPLYSVSYYYDESGRLSQVAYEDGRGIGYTYDDNDNLLTQAPLALPLPPQNLIASENPDAGIALQWDPAEGAESYTLYRRSNRNSVWIEVTELPLGTVAFLDTGYVEGLTYCYRIAAANAQGLSAYSSATALVGIAADRVALRFYEALPDARVFEIAFSTEAGESYQIESSDTLAPGDWMPTAYSPQPDAPTTTAAVQATSDSVSIYIRQGGDEGARFYRIVHLAED